MNKVAQIYREYLAALTDRLRDGERDIDALVAARQELLLASDAATPDEIDRELAAVRRDLEEFARS
ncbi:hypothetical protein EIO60_01383|nr:hypothetical protein [Candidatus Pantoea persica]